MKDKISLLTEDTLEGLNKNPRTLLNGLKVALEEKRLDYQDAIKNNNERKAEQLGSEIDDINKKIMEVEDKIGEDTKMYEGGRVQAAEGFPDLNKDGETTYADVLKGRGVFQEGGDIDGQMAMLMIPKEPKDDMMPEEDMLPDDEMEDEYLDFILDEALDSEEEDYLMEQLQSNERLSEIFDKVIDIAQEFAGSGPVEGPGSGVSDSIPARLSDGEFVFTAKAVEEIGSDKLMSMMKDAEAKADERQGLANGGEPEEENVVVESTDEPAVQKIIVEKQTTDNSSRPIMDTGEKEISVALRRDMQDPSKKYVRS